MSSPRNHNTRTLPHQFIRTHKRKSHHPFKDQQPHNPFSVNNNQYTTPGSLNQFQQPDLLNPSPLIRYRKPSHSKFPLLDLRRHDSTDSGCFIRRRRGR